MNQDQWQIATNVIFEAFNKNIQAEGKFHDHVTIHLGSKPYSCTHIIFPIIEPPHEITNTVVCATSKGSDQPAHTRSLIRAFASRLNINMSVKLLTEHHLEFLSLKGGCTDSPESTHVKMSHCWKSHVKAQLFFSRVWIEPVWINSRRKKIHDHMNIIHVVVYFFLLLECFITYSKMTLVAMCQRSRFMELTLVNIQVSLLRESFPRGKCGLALCLAFWCEFRLVDLEM